MWKKLKEDGDQLEPLKFNTLEQYKKGFKFESVAKNASIKEATEPLEIAEENLNNNPTNPELMRLYIAAAK